jgi:Tfp pilus assembly protein PilF
MPSRWPAALVPLALALGILAAVAWVYWPVHAFDWVNYDDDVYVLDNPHVVGGLSLRDLAWVATHGYAANYHPLTWASHMLDVELFGLEPGGHHLVSVGLHALNALLLFLFLRSASGRLWPSALCAALFALHPLRVESVAWVAERKDVLCGTFFLLALLAHLRQARAPGLRHLLPLCLAVLAALLAKPMAVTLPVLLLVLDFWPLGRLSGAAAVAPSSPTPTHHLGMTRGAGVGFGVWLEKLPLVGLALACALATVLAQREAGATSGLEALPLDLRVLNALASLAVYVGQSLWPSSLAVFYPHARNVAGDPRAELFAPALAGLVLLGGLFALGLRLRRRHPYLLAGWTWFVLALLPVIGLVQIGTQAHADRYTYLPGIGLGLIAAFGAADLARGRARPLVLLSFAAGPCALAGAARAQVRVWQDGQTLFEHAAAVVDRNYLAHGKLGELARARGDGERAAAEFRRALEIFPAYADALNNLALIELERGAHAAARELLERALALQPGDPQLLLNLGVVELEAGNLEAARARLEQALRSAPGEPDVLFNDVLFNLGLVLQQADRLPEAEKRLREVLELAPGHGDALNNLGQVLLLQGREAEAVQTYERLAALEPENPDAHFNLGVALERLSGPGARARAAASFRRALELDPAHELALGALQRLSGGGARR